MDEFSSRPFRPEDFSGQVRLFPLPGVAVFPHVIAVLRVFEPRYCELLQSALAGDGQITMAVLAPGWEPEYEGKPTLQSMACLGRVLHTGQRPDGSYHVLLEGLSRVRLGRELPAEHRYREAEAELAADVMPSVGGFDAIKEKLLGLFREILEKTGAAASTYAAMLDPAASLGRVTDMMAHYVPFEPAIKYQLLEEVRVVARAGLIMSQLGGVVSGHELPRAVKFPPDFSEN